MMTRLTAVSPRRSRLSAKAMWRLTLAPSTRPLTHTQSSARSSSSGTIAGRCARAQEAAKKSMRTVAARLRPALLFS